MNLLEAIERRQSIRAYDRRPVEPAVLECIRAAGDGAEPLTDTAMQFVLDAEGTSATGGMTGVVGDYGKVIVAPHYLVLATAEGPDYLVDAGWRFELAVLEATARGIGTCWIGGMFSESKMERALGLTAGLRVIALTPLGHPPVGGAKGLLQRGVHRMMGGANRKPVDKLWSWGQAGVALPSTVRQDPVLARWIEAIRRSPSWANKQRWQFVLTPEELRLYKAGEQLKEGKDYHLVDCGIAMAHAAVAGRELGLTGTWSLDRDGMLPHRDGHPAVARYVFDRPLAS